MGEGKKREAAPLGGDGLPEGDDAPVEARRPVQLPQKDHAPLVVPEAIDVLEGVGTDPGYPRDVGRALRLRHEVAEERATVGMRLGESTPLAVAADVRLAPEAGHQLA